MTNFYFLNGGCQWVTKKFSCFAKREKNGFAIHKIYFATPIWYDEVNFWCGESKCFHLVWLSWLFSALFPSCLNPFSNKDSSLLHRFNHPVVPLPPSVHRQLTLCPGTTGIQISVYPLSLLVFKFLKFNFKFPSDPFVAKILARNLLQKINLLLASFKSLLTILFDSRFQNRFNSKVLLNYLT